MQRNKINYFLRQGSALPQPEMPTRKLPSEEYELRRAQEIMDRSRVVRKRSLDTIKKSGVFEIERWNDPLMSDWHDLIHWLSHVINKLSPSTMPSMMAHKTLHFNSKLFKISLKTKKEKSHFKLNFKLTEENFSTRFLELVMEICSKKKKVFC